VTSVIDKRFGQLIPIKVISAKRVTGWPGDGIALIIPHTLGAGMTRGMPWQSGTMKRHFPLPEEARESVKGIQKPRGDESEPEVVIEERTALLPSDVGGAEGFIVVTSDQSSYVKNTSRSSNDIIYQIAEDDRIHVVNVVPRNDPLYFPLTRPWMKAGCLPYYIRNAIRSAQRPGRRNLTIAVLADDEANYFDRFYIERKGGRPISRNVSGLSPIELIQDAFDDEFSGEIGCRVRSPIIKSTSEALVGIGLLEEWQRRSATEEHNPDPVNRYRWQRYNANTVFIGYKKALASYMKQLQRHDPTNLGVDQEADPVRYAMLIDKQLSIADDWDHFIFRRFIVRGPRDPARPRIGANAEEERKVAQQQLQKLPVVDADGNLSINEDARWAMRLKTKTFDPATLVTQVGRKTMFGVVAQWLDFLGINLPLIQEGVLTRMQKEAEEEAEERKMKQAMLDPFFRDDEDEDD